MKSLLNNHIPKIVLAIISGLLIMSSCRKESFSPEQAESFIKFFGSYEMNTGNAVKRIEDGGFAIIGTTTRNSTEKIILILTDRFGNESRGSILFDSPHYSEAAGILTISDGGFAILGNTLTETSNRTFASNIHLIRTDIFGDTLWTKNYGGHSNDIAYSLTETRDGGFIIIGSSEDPVSGSLRTLLVKTDASGDTLWTRKHGMAGHHEGRSVTETETGYIYTGYTKSFSLTGQANSNIFVAKTNALGRIIHPVTFENAANDSGVSILAHPEGGYLILGKTTNPETSAENVFLARLEENISETVWEKHFGGDSNLVPASFKITENGNIAIAGTQKLTTRNHNIFLMETDPEGNMNFIKTYGDSHFQKASDLDLTEDGGYIITGTTGSGPNSMIMLIKTKPGGEL